MECWEKWKSRYNCIDVRPDDFKVATFNNTHLVFCIVFHSPSDHKRSQQNLHQNFKLTQPLIYRSKPSNQKTENLVSVAFTVDKSNVPLLCRPQNLTSLGSSCGKNSLLRKEPLQKREYRHFI